MAKEFKVGVTLSGGGVRGYAHLGFVQGLHERGVKPQIYSGVSAGAIAGAFLADGYSPKEAFQILKKKGIFSYTKVQWPMDGLLSLDGLREEIGKHISAQNLEDLSIPMVVGVSNLNTGMIEYHSKGNVCEWVVASSSIPVLFSPQKINEQIYVDGGLLDNLPGGAIREQCEQLIGINVSPIHHSETLGSLLKVAIRTFQISVDVTSRTGRDLCDLYIEPKGIGDIELLDTKSTDKVFKLGYEACMELKDSEISSLLLNA